MDDRWVEVPVLDVAPKVGRVPTVPRTQYKTVGELPVVDQGAGLIAGYTDDRSASFPGELPVILFGDHTRAWKWLPFPFAAGADGTQILRPIGSTDAKFVFYALSSLDIRNLGYSRHFKLLKESTIALPPLGEQRKIAAILSSVDEAIEKTQAVIDQVQVVKKGLMQELLTRGLPGRHKKFKQTEIGEIPASWEVGEVGDVVASCEYGLNSPLTTDDTGIPVLRMGNLQAGEVSLASLKYVAEAAFDRPDLMLRRGDVLFNRTNSPALVGKVGLYDLDKRASFASYLLRMRTRSGHHPWWLNYLLNEDAQQRALHAMATKGVSQSNINRTKLLSLPIPIPLPDEQAKIVEILDVFRIRLTVEASGLMGLQQLKQALMSVLLTGELRVTP